MSTVSNPIPPQGGAAAQGEAMVNQRANEAGIHTSEQTRAAVDRLISDNHHQIPNEKASIESSENVIMQNRQKMVDANNQASSEFDKKHAAAVQHQKDQDQIINATDEVIQKFKDKFN